MRNVLDQLVPIGVRQTTRELIHNTFEPYERFAFLRSSLQHFLDQYFSNRISCSRGLTSSVACLGAPGANGHTAIVEFRLRFTVSAYGHRGVPGELKSTPL